MELDAPNIGQLEKEYLNKVLESNFISTFGPYVNDFEEKFATRLHATSAVSTQSGTAALHVTLCELGIKASDEVIVPALTFVATANPVVYTGAHPVFVDVDLHTWNILPEEIEEAITPRTRAIIPVHFYGNPCAMDKIMNIAQKHDLYVIEDATESLGASFGGQYTGTFGDFGCFSFNGNKIITTGGGGMVLGKDHTQLEHIRFLVNQARDGSRGFFHPEIGFNYRMTNLEAGLGLAQLTRLDDFLEKKKGFNTLYRKELTPIAEIGFQAEYPCAESSWWFTGITVKEKMDAATLQQKLKEKNIPSRRVFMPLVEFPPYKEHKKREYTHSYEIYNRGLCLPSSTLNTSDDIYEVCKAIKEIFGKKY
ncbi:MAG: DegT/DnrJ/EryC1/StrS family aminotransferase [Candidatus Omnitrophica bacterium]|nr:DegT/DnrJ/EryC1/StrS family aminotransferase [Candidatus Omnitrophota bacterium]